MSIIEDYDNLLETYAAIEGIEIEEAETIANEKGVDYLIKAVESFQETREDRNES